MIRFFANIKNFTKTEPCKNCGFAPLESMYKYYPKSGADKLWLPNPMQYSSVQYSEVKAYKLRGFVD